MNESRIFRICRVDYILLIDIPRLLAFLSPDYSPDPFPPVQDQALPLDDKSVPNPLLRPGQPRLVWLLPSLKYFLLYILV